MAKLNISNEWWTAPAEAENGKLVLVTGRSGLQNVKATQKYIYRVEIAWLYEPDEKGMPDFHTSKLMGEVHDALSATFDKEPVAVNTGIYTGDGERNWVFYTKSLPTFQHKVNEALSAFQQLPLTFQAYEDSDWAEYEEMCQNEIKATN